MNRILIMLVCLFTAFSAVAASKPDDYPNRPIRLVVPYPPGGTSDPAARLLAQELAKLLGQPFIVDNRGGASGDIGTGLVARSKADGYVLLFAPSTIFTMNPQLYKTLGWAESDFRFVMNFSSVPNLFTVNPSLPAHTLGEFVKYVKGLPANKLSYATVGQGSTPNLAVQMFMTKTGTKMLQVPYVSPGQAVMDTIVNRTQLTVELLPTASEQVKSGKLRGLAVLANTRSNVLPDIPTATEAGMPGIEASTYFTIAAPSATPDAIISQLNKAINTLLHNSTFHTRLIDLGLTPIGGAPAEASKMVKSESARWGEVIKNAGIEPQ